MDKLNSALLATPASKAKDWSTINFDALVNPNAGKSTAPDLYGSTQLINVKINSHSVKDSDEQLDFTVDPGLVVLAYPETVQAMVGTLHQMHHSFNEQLLASIRDLMLTTKINQI